MSLCKISRASFFACGFAAAIGILALNSPAQAATYYWTTAGSGSALAGGSGTWDASGSYPNWATDTTGASVGAWSTTGTDTAEFYNGSGTVAVNNTQLVGSITFDAGTGYTLIGGALNLTGGSINAVGNATIASGIAGSVGLNKLGSER